MGALEVYTADGRRKLDTGGGGGGGVTLPIDAADVDVADAGGYFTATDVEAVLQELAALEVAGNSTTLGGGAFRNSIRSGDQAWMYTECLALANNAANVVAEYDGWTTVTAGTGSTVKTGTAVYAEHPGVLILDTGTNAAGISGIYGSPAPSGILTVDPQIALGTGRTRMGAWVRYEDVGDVTNNFKIRVGFLDRPDAGGAQQNGIYFQYNYNLSGGNWEIYGEVATVESGADSGIAAAVDTWYYLEVDVAEDGETATFYINGSSVGTRTGAAIPEGTAAPVMPGVQIAKSAGTTRRTCEVDAIYFMQGVNR